MSPVADSSVVMTLPPLHPVAEQSSVGQRILSLALVLGLHLGLGYLALYLSVMNNVIELPASIAVRLLPLAPSQPSVKDPAPTPKLAPKVQHEPVHKALPVPSRPVLATPAAAASDFVVAPQPAAPPVPVAVPAAPVANSAPQAISAARFDADYLHNPKPVYPTFSRRNGEEGKVLLKVRVSAQGSALDVTVSKSSGFPRLDTAAQEAVGRWRFIAARRGDEPVESSVIVPITFTLD